MHWTGGNYGVWVLHNRHLGDLGLEGKFGCRNFGHCFVLDFTCDYELAYWASGDLGLERDSACRIFKCCILVDFACDNESGFSTRAAEFRHGVCQEEILKIPKLL